MQNENFGQIPIFTSELTERGRDFCMLIFYWPLDVGSHSGNHRPGMLASLMHLHLAWNVLLPARRDGDLLDLLNA